MKPCPYPLSAVLPHAAPMILLDAAVEYGDDAVRTSVHITGDAPFMRDGRVPSYVGIEYMAQTIGVFQGVHALEQGKPVRVGFLLGTRKLLLHAPFFEIGDRLAVEARLQYSDGQIGSFDCRISRRETLVAEARLTVYDTRDDTLITMRTDGQP